MNSTVVGLHLPDQAGDVVAHTAPGGGGSGQAVAVGVEFGVAEATVAIRRVVVGGVPPLVAVLPSIDVARTGGVVSRTVIAAPGDACVVERLLNECGRDTGNGEAQLVGEGTGCAAVTVGTELKGVGRAGGEAGEGGAALGGTDSADQDVALQVLRGGGGVDLEADEGGGGAGGEGPAQTGLTDCGTGRGGEHRRVADRAEDLDIDALPGVAELVIRQVLAHRGLVKEEDLFLVAAGRQAGSCQGQLHQCLAPRRQGARGGADQHLGRDGGGVPVEGLVASVNHGQRGGQVASVALFDGGDEAVALDQ